MANTEPFVPLVRSIKLKVIEDTDNIEVNSSYEVL